MGSTGESAKRVLDVIADGCVGVRGGVCQLVLM